jgi:hypothetical protein
LPPAEWWGLLVTMTYKIRERLAFYTVDFHTVWIQGIYYENRYSTEFDAGKGDINITIAPQSNMLSARQRTALRV